MTLKAIEDILPSKTVSKVALFMKSGVGYSTASEVKFTREQPYQLVEGEEVLTLLKTGRFRLASPEEVKEFYGI